MSDFGEDERMLSKVIRALMHYYGPMTLIRAVIIEADRVIEDMAVEGHIKEAKQFASVLGGIRDSMIGAEK